jgi:DNA-binding NarL/FixJ family response regulator
MTADLACGELGTSHCAEQGGEVRVLLAVRDVRVRRALSRLLELNGHRIVGAADSATRLPQLDAELSPDVVVLELDRRDRANGLLIVGELAQRGAPVIVVSSGFAPCASIIAAGAQACLDKDLAFSDRLARALRAVAADRMLPPPARPEGPRPSD